MLMKTISLSLKMIYFLVSIILVSISCTKNEDINNQGNMNNKGKLISISDGHLKTVLEYDNDGNVIGGIDRSNGEKITIKSSPLTITKFWEREDVKEITTINDITTNNNGYITSAKIKSINTSNSGEYTVNGTLIATYINDKYISEIITEFDNHNKSNNSFIWKDGNIIKHTSEEVYAYEYEENKFAETYYSYFIEYDYSQNITNSGIFIPSAVNCDNFFSTELLFYAGYFGEKTSHIPTYDYFYSEDKGESNTIYNTTYNKYNLISSIVIDNGYDQEIYTFQYE